MVTKFIHNDPADGDAGIEGWPFPTESTNRINSTDCYRVKLYVFAGTHGKTHMELKLTLVLDLKTKEWRRLSGTVMAPKDADLTIPGPRKTSNGWVIGVTKKCTLSTANVIAPGCPLHPRAAWWRPRSSF